jgi:DNA-binding winged helix-turn-helix (wHTH) protein/Tol biopolymer transport system component
MPESRHPSPPGDSQAGETGLAAVKFGPYTLDLETRKLRRGDEVLALPSRAFDALAYLITHRDRTVDRDEIIAAVWHDVAVTDDSLIHAVSLIRRALGDDPSHATFIETIPRRGYRFVGRVEAIEPTAPPRLLPDTDAARSETSGPRFAAWRERPAIAAAVAGVVITAGLVFGGRALTSEDNLDGSSRLEQIAPFGTTLVSGGVVSPVGRQLAFVARDERTGKTGLWIRAIDAIEPRALPDTEGASHPFFSPDGQVVAFFRDDQLIAADVTGKRRRTVAPVRGAPAGGSWGADNVIVFAEWMTGLFAVPASGGRVSPLTRLDHTALDVAHAWPQFLPDGRHFLYQVVSPDTTRAGVYVSSLDSRTSTRLLDDASVATYVDPGFLLYVQRDMLMAEPFDAAQLRLGGRAVLLSRGVAAPSLAEGTVASASRDMLAFRAGAGKQQLTWVDRSGQRQGALEVPASMFNFRVSPDGLHVLAASSLTDSTGVWLVDLARRHSTQLTSDGIAPLWSPDGTHVAFTARAGLDLHVRPSHELAGIEPLFSDQSVKVLNDWSARSQAIIYTRHDPVTKLDLWHVPLVGGAARPLLDSVFNEAHARISPDGRWLAYVSDDTSTQEVYVRRYPDLDAPRQVSNGGGEQPQWRADQRELFYLSPDRSLMAATVIERRDVSFGAPRRLFRTSIAEGPSAARDSYAAMPDGRSFLIDARRDASTKPITVMLDWTAGLTSVPTPQPAFRRATEVAGGITRSRDPSQHP